MKLTIAMMSGGLIFLSGISNVHAGMFTSESVQCEESTQTSALNQLPSESRDIDTTCAIPVVNVLAESACDRIEPNASRPKGSLDRVDLVIKRSRHGIQISFAPQPDHVTSEGHPRLVKSGSGEFDVPSRICSLSEDSFERMTGKTKEPSASGEFGHTEREGLFGGKLTLMPGLTSLVLATLDLIGVVIGCYRQRRSFVV